MVQTNQIVRHVNNLNLAHPPEMVVAGGGQLRKYIALVFFLLIFVKWEYQCLRLEGEVDWVASGPWRENDIELQSN